MFDEIFDNYVGYGINLPKSVFLKKKKKTAREMQKAERCFSKRLLDQDNPVLCFFSLNAGTSFHGPAQL